MNKTLSLILWAPISIAIGLMLSQMAFAAVVRDAAVVEKVCYAGGNIPPDLEDTDPYDTGNESGNESEEISEWLGTYESKLEESYDKKKCGTKNTFTLGLEKGDCTADGKIITEITEPVGPAVTLGEDKVIDVYTGICCLAAHEGGEQDDPYCQGEVDYNDLPDYKNEDGDVIGKAVPDCSYCTETRTIYYDNYTDCNENASHCERRQWLISSTGAGLVKTYVKQMYIFGAGIGGFIAVVIMVASGIQISVSGVTGDISAAKDRIIQSITGLVLLFLSGLILYTINPTFFG